MNDDTISRKAVIDEIDEWIKAFRENGHNESAADARLTKDGIIQLPSVQPQRWISVSEALPDRYIVGGDGKHYSQDVLMTVIYRDDDIFIDYGQMVDDEWYSEMDKEIITSPFEVVAWMPLPPVYEGGNK